MRTVAQKMGVKEGSRAFFVNVNDEILDAINLPNIHIEKQLKGEFDYIHLFVKTQAAYKELFPQLKSHLRLGGMLWVSWPKGGQLGTDLSLPKVISIGYDFGLVESTCLSVNPLWSALKFTFPKKGITYNNSYGKLNVSEQ